jgi:hypothetical protein
MAFNNDEKILSQAALQQKDKTVIDFDFIKNIASLVLKTIGIFVKGPGKIYYNFHTTQITILIEFVLNFKGFDPIYEGIGNLEKNLDDYIRETQRLVQIEGEIPTSPWPNESIVLVFLISYLKTNPQFVKPYNAHLDNYQLQMQKAIEYAAEIREEGQSVEQSLRQDIDQLIKGINNIPISSKFSDVMKARLLLRLEKLITETMLKVSEARISVDDIIIRLQKRRNKALNADRL